MEEIQNIQFFLKEIQQILNCERKIENFDKQKEMFDLFDVNDNGFLSYRECVKGLIDTLNMPQLESKKSAIFHAFQLAKDSNQENSRLKSSEFIELNEFRYFLCFFRKFLEFWEMYCLINRDGNSRITFEEFEAGEEYYEKWGMKRGNIVDIFKKIDKDKSQTIKFDEFIEWAYDNNLNLDQNDIFDDTCLKKIKSKCPL